MPPSTGIAAPADTREVTHTPPRRNSSRRILPFTRHPKLLARAARLQIQACAVRVLCLLLTTADNDGISWVSPREMCHLLPRSGKVQRYSLPQVLRSLRTLRDLGLLVWDSLPAMSCFPARIEGQAVAGAGRFTESGGRVWRVVLEAVKQAPISPSRPTASSLLGAIMHDRPPPIMHDRPSDRSPSEIFKSDPARAEPPRAENEASETPSARAPRPLSESRALRPEAPPAPRTSKVASETPRVNEASQATSDAQPAPQSREELQRGSSRANETPASPEPTADVRQIAADLAWLYEPEKHSPPPGTRPRKPS
jgi:hypothetical protein